MTTIVQAVDHGVRGSLGAIRDIASKRMGLLALVLMTILVAVLLFGPAIAPYDPLQQHIVDRLQPPSSQYLLGTDSLGRDLLSRAIYGARIEMSVAIPASILALLSGLAIGALAGYIGGRTDKLLVILMDSMQAFPAVILALALLALLGPSLRNVTLVVAVTFAPAYARMSRASVFVVREEPYIAAERSLGARDSRILTLHILPNILAPLFILTAINIPIAVTIASGLSFLGLGVPPPQPGWGIMLSDGFSTVQVSPWPVIVPGVALAATTLAFTLLGEALRDYLDPRLSGGDRMTNA